MLKYKQFLRLNEGGNIQLGTPTEIKAGKGGPKAAAFDSSKRATTAPDIHGALLSIADKVHKQHGVHIYGKDSVALKEPSGGKSKEEHAPSGYTSGSTEFLYHPKISDSTYAEKLKSGTGDVDTLMNRDHKEHLDHTLSSMPVGTKLGKCTYLGWKKGGDESHVLLQHPDHKDPVQVDMRHAQYEGQHPSEGAQFSLSGGSLDDRGMGIKGADHKRMLNSIANQSEQKWGPKGLKHKDAAPSSEGDMNPMSVSKKLFGVEHEGVRSFSGLIGLAKEKFKGNTAALQSIHDKFKSSLGKDADTSKALKHLQTHFKPLGVKV